MDIEWIPYGSQLSWDKFLCLWETSGLSSTLYLICGIRNWHTQYLFLVWLPIGRFVTLYHVSHSSDACELMLTWWMLVLDACHFLKPFVNLLGVHFVPPRFLSKLCTCVVCVALSVLSGRASHMRICLELAMLTQLPLLFLCSRFSCSKRSLRVIIA